MQRLYIEDLTHHAGSLHKQRLQARQSINQWSIDLHTAQRSIHRQHLLIVQQVDHLRVDESTTTLRHVDEVVAQQLLHQVDTHIGVALGLQVQEVQQQKR